MPEAEGEVGTVLTEHSTQTKVLSVCVASVAFVVLVIYCIRWVPLSLPAIPNASLFLLPKSCRISFYMYKQGPLSKETLLRHDNASPAAPACASGCAGACTSAAWSSVAACPAKRRSVHCSTARSPVSTHGAPAPAPRCSVLAALHALPSHPAGRAARGWGRGGRAPGEGGVPASRVSPALPRAVFGLGDRTVTRPSAPCATGGAGNCT